MKNNHNHVSISDSFFSYRIISNIYQSSFMLICLCIGFNVIFNTFQVILGRCLLVTEGMITTAALWHITTSITLYGYQHIIFNYRECFLLFLLHLKRSSLYFLEENCQENAIDKLKRFSLYKIESDPYHIMILNCLASYIYASCYMYINNGKYLNID